MTYYRSSGISKKWSRLRLRGYDVTRAIILNVGAALLFGAAASGVDLSNCRMCHKEGGISPPIPVAIYSSPHAALNCLDCHIDAAKPHKGGPTTLGCGSCHRDKIKALAASAHTPRVKNTPRCYNCHGGGHYVVSLESSAFLPYFAPKICAQCHSQEVANYVKSSHGVAAQKGNVSAPACYLCHGEPHSIEKTDADARLSRQSLPRFCGYCHTGKRPTNDSPYTVPDPRRQLLASVHGRRNKDTVLFNATCDDCHPPHQEQPSWNPTSSTNFMNVPGTCGRCHPDEFQLYRVSVHGLAAAAGVKDAPTCQNCHGDHNVVAIEQKAPGKRTRVVAVCSSCHYSLTLSAKFDIAKDRVQTFEGSYHGLVSEGGKMTAADCGSCHGVHDVLPPSDPRSSVYPANLETTCGTCHFRVTERFAGTNVHKPQQRPRRTPADYVAFFYIALIIIIVGGMVGHNSLDYIRKVKAVHASRLAGALIFTRLSKSERIQHILLLATFSLLAFTGFSIKFPSSWVFAWLVRIEGPYPIRVTTHKILGIILIATSVFHIAYLLLTRAGRARFKAIFPRFADVRDASRSVLHKLGLVKKEPEYDEFNYAEKAEYWALVWGNVVMATTGLYMWFDGYFQQYFPYWFYNAIRAVHFYEAVLAVLSIIVWHLYFVIFDPATYPMNFAWWDGKVAEDVLRREKPRFLEKIIRTRRRAKPGKDMDY